MTYHRHTIGFYGVTLLCSALYLLLLTPELITFNSISSFELPDERLNSVTFQEILSNNPLLKGFLLGSGAILIAYNLTRLIITRNLQYTWLLLIQLMQIIFLLSLSDTFSFWQYHSLQGYSYYFHFPAIIIFTLSQLLTVHITHNKRGFNQPSKHLISHLILTASLAILMLLSEHSLISTLSFLLLSCFTLYPAVLFIVHAVSKPYPPAFLLASGLLMLNLPLLLSWPLLSTPISNTLNILILTSLISIPFTGYLLSLALTSHEENIIIKRYKRLQQNDMQKTYKKAQSDLLAQISHEVRTPMNGVLGMTGLLLETPLSIKQRDYVSGINRAGNELLSLINGVLDISHAQSNQIELHLAQFELNALISDCLEAFTNQAHEQQVELVSFIQPQVPRLAHGDPMRLRQVILSLLNSAFRRTQQAEIIVTVTIKNDDTLCVSVQNYGEPLGKKEQDLLNQFSTSATPQLTQDTVRKHLGVAIASYLTRLMQGSLNYTQDRQSSTLTLVAPLLFVPNKISENSMLDLLNDQAVLIVEPNLVCRQILVQHCQEWGMNVFSSATALEALAILRTQANLQQKIHVLLITKELTDLTGLELAVRIQEEEDLAHECRLILLSNSSPNTIDARNAGINYILLKPISHYTLKATLADAFAHQKSYKSTLQQKLPSREAMRVLVVEDNAISTKVISGLLKKLNIKCDSASSGEQALSQLKSKPYDLVLMDCQMPTLDGFKTTELWRAYERKHNLKMLPIIALTAHVLDEYKEQALASGMNGHLAKPVDFNQLTQLIRNYSK